VIKAIDRAILPTDEKLFHAYLTISTGEEDCIHAPEETKTRPVRKQITTVSQNVPVAETRA